MGGESAGIIKTICMGYGTRRYDKDGYELA
jgi:hypothetical protein